MVSTSNFLRNWWMCTSKTLLSIFFSQPYKTWVSWSRERKISKDNGLGINASEKSKLFQAFYTTQEHGTGLGLYFCKAMMHAHLGDIIVQGRADKYADFILKFPPPEAMDKHRERYYKTAIKHSRQRQKERRKAERQRND